MPAGMGEAIYEGILVAANRPHCEKLHKEAYESRVRGNSERSDIKSASLNRDHVEEGRRLLVVETPQVKLTQAGHKDKTVLP